MGNDNVQTEETGAEDAVEVRLGYMDSDKDMQLTAISSTQVHP